MSALRGLTAGLVFLAAGFASTQAGAAELKVLSVEAMKPALQQLVPAFEASSKNKLKVEYASAATVEKKIGKEDSYDVVILGKAATDKLSKAAKIPAGSIKPVAKHDNHNYVAGMTNWTEQPLAASALIEFLNGPKAAAAYKSAGLQPG